jgi:DMSO/TMAO reductase YedYZ molybdopterin-dependent catalytic subunit
MALLRATLEVRTVPERVMEWVLLLIPIGLFEASLQRFGFDAKRYAFYATVMGLLALLAALGALVLWRRSSTRALVAVGLGLWLFAMLIIMPLTGAGVFASALLDGKKGVIGGYFAVALLFAATLAVASALTPRERTVLVRRPETWTDAPSRRTALAMMGGALAGYAALAAVARWGPKSEFQRVIVLDPQQPVPSGGIDRPHAHPDVVSASSASAGPLPATGDPFAPPPARQLRRDQDGAILSAGRRPGELAPVVTDNDDFYVVTKNAGGDPELSTAQWRLVLDGEVGRSVQLDYRSLRNLPAVEVTKTLECISNFVAKCELAPFGCGLISTARWTGVRLSDLLELAGGLKPGAVSLAVISADEFITALPVEVALDPETLLVYQMNGQVLPREHGYPARVLVPGRYGMKSGKWVVGLRAVARDFADWYGQRNWSQQAIVKTMTRIDVPAPDAHLAPGEHRIAGIAYAGDRGVAKVEFSPDGGQTWSVADLLEPAAGRDAWVRWEGRFTLRSGARVTLVSRATDRTGELQIEAFSLPQPDGSSGWHTIDVRAASA